MYVYCGEDSIEYLVDTEAEKVYELTIGENEEVISYSEHRQEMQNFLRWRPYLQIFKETNDRPNWLNLEMSPSDIKEAGCLTRDLYFAFELKKYKKGQDLLVQIENVERVRKHNEGLQTICQFLVNEFCKDKQAPLWGLKYCATNENQNDKERQAFCDTIDSIIEIASNGYSKEMAHNMYLLLMAYKYDFTYICRCIRQNNLLEGFCKYILSDKKARINEGELNDAITFLKENGQKPIYLLTDKMVTDGIWEYRQSCPILKYPPIDKN